METKLEGYLLTECTIITIFTSKKRYLRHFQYKMYSECTIITIFTSKKRYLRHFQYKMYSGKK